MSWKNCIEKNIFNELVKQGSPRRSRRGEPMQLYRRMFQGSAKGRIYDDCLRHARVWAEKYSLPAGKKNTKGAAPRKRQ